MTTIINLDPDFTPYWKGSDLTRFNFAGGEAHIKILSAVNENATITCRIKSSDDLMTLLLVTDALKREGAEKIELFMPYLPYARQDRQMVKGEPLSLKVFADLINSQQYSSVTVFDPHSDVAPALINNCNVISNHRFVKSILQGLDNYYIISPDAGAYKKIFAVSQYVDYRDEIIMCNKLRDVSNGTLRSVTVSHEDLKGKDCYIIDDICDGGGTFVLLSEELRKRNAGKINLIVSHGIFSQGEDVLHTHLNRIYTTDSFKDIQSSFIIQTKLSQLL